METSEGSAQSMLQVPVSLQSRANRFAQHQLAFRIARKTVRSYRKVREKRSSQTEGCSSLASDRGTMVRKEDDRGVRGPGEAQEAGESSEAAQPAGVSCKSAPNSDAEDSAMEWDTSKLRGRKRAADRRGSPELPPDVRDELASLRELDFDPRSIQKPRLDLPDAIKETGWKSPKRSSEKGNWKAEILSVLSKPARSAEEYLAVLEARDKLIRIRNRQHNRLAKNNVGTCPDMCPEKERYLRIARHQVDVYECSRDTKEPSHSLMVKRYSRSSADQQMPLAHDLRPVPVLVMTMNYLVNHFMDLVDEPGENVGEWYHFLWDRMRSIRKDMTQLEVCDVDAVSILEMCARFHIYSMERMREEKRAVFDEKINRENLTKCLQSLHYMYDDLALKKIHCSSVNEFIAYSILLHLNNDISTSHILSLSSEKRHCVEIQFAIKVYLALQSRNYVRFFRLVKSTTYLNACLMHQYFSQVRAHAMRSIIHAYSRQKMRNTYPLQVLKDQLLFDSIEDVKEFCTFSGVAMDGDSIVLEEKILRPIPMQEDTKRSYIGVEMKRDCSVREVVSGKRGLPDLWQLHEVHMSFDAQGVLKADAWYAGDQGVQLSEAGQEPMLKEKDASAPREQESLKADCKRKLEVKDREFPDLVEKPSTEKPSSGGKQPAPVPTPIPVTATVTVTVPTPSPSPVAAPQPAVAVGSVFSKTQPDGSCLPPTTQTHSQADSIAAVSHAIAHAAMVATGTVAPSIPKPISTDELKFKLPSQSAIDSFKFQLPSAAVCPLGPFTSHPSTSVFGGTTWAPAQPQAWPTPPWGASVPPPSHSQEVTPMSVDQDEEGSTSCGGTDAGTSWLCSKVLAPTALGQGAPAPAPAPPFLPAPPAPFLPAPPPFLPAPAAADSELVAKFPFATCTSVAMSASPSALPVVPAAWATAPLVPPSPASAETTLQPMHTSFIATQEPYNPALSAPSPVGSMNRSPAQSWLFTSSTTFTPTVSDASFQPVAFPFPVNITPTSPAINLEHSSDKSTGAVRSNAQSLPDIAADANAITQLTTEAEPDILASMVSMNEGPCAAGPGSGSLHRAMKKIERKLTEEQKQAREKRVQALVQHIASVWRRRTFRHVHEARRQDRLQPRTSRLPLAEQAAALVVPAGAAHISHTLRLDICADAQTISENRCPIYACDNKILMEDILKKVLPLDDKTRGYNQNIYWKLLISLPDECEAQRFSLQLMEWVDEIFCERPTTDNQADVLRFNVTHVTEQHKMTTCVQKITGSLSAANGANGFLFFTPKSYTNVSMCKARFRQMVEVQLDSHRPVAVVATSIHWQQTCLSWLSDAAQHSEISSCRIFGPLHSGAPSNVQEVHRAVEWLVQQAPEPAPLIGLRLQRAVMLLMNSMWMHVNFSLKARNLTGWFEDPLDIICLYNSALKRLYSIIANPELEKFGEIASEFKEAMKQDYLTKEVFSSIELNPIWKEDDYCSQIRKALTEMSLDSTALSKCGTSLDVFCEVLFDLYSYLKGPVWIYISNKIREGAQVDWIDLLQDATEHHIKHVVGKEKYENLVIVFHHNEMLKLLTSPWHLEYLKSGLKGSVCSEAGVEQELGKAGMVDEPDEPYKADTTQAPLPTAADSPSHSVIAELMLSFEGLLSEIEDNVKISKKTKKRREKYQELDDKQEMLKLYENQLGELESL